MWDLVRQSSIWIFGPRVVQTLTIMVYGYNKASEKVEGNSPLHFLAFNRIDIFLATDTS